MNAREILEVMIRTDRGSMTVWSPAEVRHALAAYRAEVRTEVLRAAIEAVEDPQARRRHSTTDSLGLGWESARNVLIAMTDTAEKETSA